MTWPECVGTQECHFAVLQSIILLLYSVLSIQDQGCIEVCWSANERNIAGTEKLQLLVPVKLLRLRPEMTVESFWRCCNEQMSPLWVFFCSLPITAGYELASSLFRAIVNKKQCEMSGLFMSLVIHYWVQDSHGVSTSEMTCVLSGGALNSTYWLNSTVYWLTCGLAFLAVAVHVTTVQTAYEGLLVRGYVGTISGDLPPSTRDVSVYWIISWHSAGLTFCVYTLSVEDLAVFLILRPI